MMVSIVIPVWNGAEWLDDAISSAVDQTEECDIIVVDDGSTDNSYEIASKYPVRIVQQVNQGLASARNTGIMAAVGDYILFLDADDILLENAARKLREAAEVTNADVVAASFKTFGKEEGLVILLPSPSIEDFKVANRIGYSALIKKSALIQVGGYSPKMTWGYEDYHLWFKMLSRGKNIVTLPDVLWLYRTKERSMIHEAQEHHEELMAQIKKDFPQIYA